MIRRMAQIFYHRLHRIAPELADKLCEVWMRNEKKETVLEEVYREPVREEKKGVQNEEAYQMVYSRMPSGELELAHLNIAFIVPKPIKGSGGHRNFYRAIKYLHEFGHDMTVYYTQTSEHADVVKQKVSDWFYDMTDIPYICYDGTLGYHDVCVATWWETVYLVKKNIEKVKFPFYYVQDFEPAFYPVCSNYILAENSYKQGFSHICSGKWCRDFLQEKYHAEAEYFQFPVDTSIYHTGVKRTKKELNIIFFAKPDLDRRCFELGILALQQVKELVPEVEIFLFGSNYVNAKDVPFEAERLGLLPTLEDLASLYRNADLGIVFSTTNPSLVPYEMLSCGCAVADLDLDGALSKYGDMEDNVFLCSPEPDIMARQIRDILADKAEMHRRAEHGRQWVLRSFPDELAMAHTVEQMIKNKIEKGTVNL